MDSAAAPTEVREAFERCRKRFPALDLPFEVFLPRIQEIASSGADEPDSRSAIQYEDLYLATACTRGDRIAWEYFVEQYVPAVRGFAEKACRNFHEAEDLCQQIVTVLMEDRTKLGSYNGRGSLAGWLRVAVAHAAIDRFRRASKQVSLDQMQENGSNPVRAAENEPRTDERADSRWGPVFCNILAREIRRLPARDRLLLSLYYLQSVPLNVIGRHFGVHESTASRWLEGLRRGLQRSIERELRVRHGLKHLEIESLWVWASRVESFSLERVLGNGAQGSVAAGPEGVLTPDP